MAYRFATRPQSYLDLASGRVLRSRPGHAAFPARLALEMFQQARALRAGHAPDVLYDPCCGVAHLITTVALLEARALSAVVASDADAGVLELARANLQLLTPGGLATRAAALDAEHHRHGNPAHREAAESARALAVVQAGPLPVHTFVADARDAAVLQAQLGPWTPGIVLADVPYGQLSAWSDPTDGAPVLAMLDALAAVLAPGAVVAVATPREAKVSHAGFRRARQLPLGHRRVTWLVRAP